jgi:hypothetical protein
MTDQPTLETLTEDQLAELLADARAFRNQPSLRTCLFPGCMRQYDAITYMSGQKPPRPEWDGKGWAMLGNGAMVGGDRNVCPDHKGPVIAHFPRRLELPNKRWGIDCGCGWAPSPQRYAPILRAQWEQHLLEQTGALPPAPPLTDPEHRFPLTEHTEASLAELYDRLWDVEADYQDLRDFARSCFVAYTMAVPALLGVQTALEHLRQRITLDSRDWSADKLDAWLWAVLVGWNCENTDEDHTHNDIDCAGDQGLWTIGNKHQIPTDQVIQAGQHRWWIANAIKVAHQIEDNAKLKEG